MTITAQPTRNEYTATAGQTIFTYTFKIFESTDIIAFVTPVGQIADDTADSVTVMSVTGVGDEAGGTVTLNAVDLNNLVTLVSAVPETRTTDYQNNGDFFPYTVNADFDRVVSLVKQAIDKVDRGVVVQESQQGASPLVFPQPEVGKILGWANDLLSLINKTVQGTVIDPNSVLLGDIEQITTQRALGRNTALTGDVEEVTIAQMLNWFVAIAQGDILFRGAAGFQRLPAGTTGTFLKTQGAAANPLWSVIQSATTTTKGIVEKSTGAENATPVSDLVYPTVLGATQVIDAHATISKEFASTGQTITSAGSLSLAHGLGAEPKIVQLILQNTTDEHGFVSGDRLTTNVGSQTSVQANSVYLGAVNVNVKFSDNANCFIAANKSTGANVALTNANWDLYVRAFL